MYVFLLSFDMNRVIPAISIKYGLYYTAFSTKNKIWQVTLRLFDMIHDISREIEKKRQVHPLTAFLIFICFYLFEQRYINLTVCL